MSLITISGKVLLPNGYGPTGGEIIATLSANATLGDDRAVGRKRIPVPDGGDLALASPALTIVANDALDPSNTFYDVEYLLRDRDGVVHGKRELWQLAGSGTQAIGTFPVIEIPPSLIIDGIVPFFGASEPPKTSSYLRALRCWKPSGRPEICGILLRNYDGGTLTWKRLADGEP